MKTLSKHDLCKLEEYWSNHTANKKLLQYREWELTAKSNHDENTGGGRSGVSNPTEQLASKLLNDLMYQNLKTIITSVERLYEHSDAEVKTIINMRYWDTERNCYEWEDIADKLFISRSKVLRMRNNLLDDTADMIGWV